jgi:tRNA(adenine34) deaminase
VAILPPDDDAYMQLALDEAAAAATEGEVPVGAVVVRDRQVLGRGHNACERLQDATAHAEVIAIGAASRSLDNWRLEDCTLYVTVEPCPMCMGACLNARITRVVYGAAESRAGACGSVVDLSAPPGYNHRLVVEGGVRAAEAAALMRDFFRRLRHQRSVRPAADGLSAGDGTI